MRGQNLDSARDARQGRALLRRGRQRERAFRPKRREEKADSAKNLGEIGNHFFIFWRILQVSILGISRLQREQPGGHPEQPGGHAEQGRPGPPAEGAAERELVVERLRRLGHRGPLLRNRQRRRQIRISRLRRGGRRGEEAAGEGPGQEEIGDVRRMPGGARNERVRVPKVIFCDLSLLLSPHEAIRCNRNDKER